LFTREPLDRARINRADSSAQREVGSGNRNESTEGDMDETTRMTLLSLLAALAAAGGDGGQAINVALLNALTAIDSPIPLSWMERHQEEGRRLPHS
jgi:hypothetical protein